MAETMAGMTDLPERAMIGVLRAAADFIQGVQPPGMDAAEASGYARAIAELRGLADHRQRRLSDVERPLPNDAVRRVSWEVFADKYPDQVSEWDTEERAREVAQSCSTGDAPEHWTYRVVRADRTLVASYHDAEEF